MQQDKDSLSIRIIEILKFLVNGIDVDLKALSQEFNVSLRTLQRDMEKLCKHLPIHKSNGLYSLEPYALGSLSYKDMQYFAFVSGLKNLYPRLNADFIVDVLNPNVAKTFIVTPPPRQSPDYKVFETLSIAIANFHKVSFVYKDKTRLVEPYRIIHIKGIWYLLATQRGVLKHFTLSKILQLKNNHTTFKPKREILTLIESQSTEWRTENERKAMICVDKSALEFFTRKGTPKYLRQIATNAQRAVFEMSYAFDYEVLNLAKMWLPTVSILEPKELQNAFIELLKGYIDKQRGDSL